MAYKHIILTTMSLFKQERPKARRVYRVENLNSKMGISSSMRVSKDQREYVVCLCLTDRTIKTEFKSEGSALDQLRKYRELYKQKKVQ